MDRRLHDRLTLKLDARVVNLSCADRSEQGQILDASQAGVCLMLPTAAAAGDLLRVEFSEGTLFGQVMHSTPDGAAYRIGVEIFEILLGASDLSRLIESTLTDRLKPVPPS